MRPVTLVFPPTRPFAVSTEDQLVERLKQRAYGYWRTVLERKYGAGSRMERALPSRANPVPLGLLSLSTYLKKAGVAVDYVHGDYWLGRDLTLDDFGNLVAERTSPSGICGFYATTPTITETFDLVERVKARHPQSVTVIGGPHVTFADVESLERCPSLDLVVRGEGEATLFEVSTAKGPPSDWRLAGTSTRHEGVPLRCADRPLLEAAEIPGPDFEVLPEGIDLVLTTMASRGCRFRCRFCTESKIWNHQVRYRDPRSVGKELRLIRTRFGQGFIHLADSEIDAAPTHLSRLLDTIEAEHLDCCFSVNLRPDAYRRLDLRMLRRMKALGIVAWFVGVESGCDRMMERMGRGSCFADFCKTLDLLKYSGAELVIPYLMLGFPGETADSMRETEARFLPLLEDGSISFLFPKLFIPYPGTDPYANPERFAIELSKNWAAYERFGFPPPFTSRCLSNTALRAGVLRFYEGICGVLERRASGDRRAWNA